MHIAAQTLFETTLPRHARLFALIRQQAAWAHHEADQVVVSEEIALAFRDMACRSLKRG